MGLGLVDGFREAIRVMLGLPADPGMPPDLVRLGLYRARVDVCQSDGGHVDVTPDDKRISPEKNVPVRVGIPGSYAVVSPGAVVLLGWTGGDPKLPYCVPSWETGATVTKLVIKATTVYLGDEAGTDALVKKSEFNGHTHKYNPGPSAATDTLVPTALAVGTTNVQAK